MVSRWADFQNKNKIKREQLLNVSRIFGPSIYDDRSPGVPDSRSIADFEHFVRMCPHTNGWDPNKKQKAD